MWRGHCRCVWTKLWWWFSRSSNSLQKLKNWSVASASHSVDSVLTLKRGVSLLPVNRYNSKRATLFLRKGLYHVFVIFRPVCFDDNLELIPVLELGRKILFGILPMTTFWKDSLKFRWTRLTPDFLGRNSERHQWRIGSLKSSVLFYDTEQGRHWNISPQPRSDAHLKPETCPLQFSNLRLLHQVNGQCKLSANCTLLLSWQMSNIRQMLVRTKDKTLKTKGL